MALKNIFTSIGFMAVSGLGAQQHWSAVTPFPGIARDDASGITCNGYAYMGTGFGVGFVMLNDWWRYDFETDSWAMMAALPGEPRQYTAIATAGSDIYLLGGITASGCSDELWVYHTQYNSWDLLTHFPGGPCQAPVLSAANGKIYAGLGRCDSVYSNNWWSFDLRYITWEELMPFPGQARFDPIHETVNERIVVGAGVSESGAEHDTYEYDIPAAMWRKTGDFPGCGFFYTAQVSSGRNIYVMAGSNEAYEHCPGAYKYETGPLGHGWSVWQTDLMNPVRKGGCAFLYKDLFYYACGIDSAGNRLNKLEYVFTGEQNIEPPGNFVVYPSPADDYICIESDRPVSGKLSLYNSVGQPQPLFIPALNDVYFRLDISGLGMGIYFLKYTDMHTGATKVLKFVKN